MKTRFAIAASLVLSLHAATASAQPNGFIHANGKMLFPIGSYELPKDDAVLEAMAESGFNLIRCATKDDLDRVHALGMFGVVPLPLDAGVTDELRERAASVANHPALAVWEGPDEIVWNFTAFSGLHRTMGIHKTPDEWKRQTPEAIAYAEEQAARIMPNMRAAAEHLRSLAPRVPVWINEAQNSDLYYVRQYMDFIDITGCDLYPVKATTRPVARIGATTDRWLGVGRGKPVWMVLQAFSWNELGDYYGATETAYPAFAESRFMAYDAIVHGARGILYWGSQFMKSEPFRESVHAVARELAMLQPFLVSAPVESARVTAIEVHEDATPPQVAATVRQAGGEWLVIVVNCDAEPHYGVVVDGLGQIEGRELHLLYGNETKTVAHGELITRLLANEVKVFATSMQFQHESLNGRDFVN